MKNKIEVIYPDTKKIEQTDIYFDTEVNDPYRWLEDDLSDETRDWVERQNKVTFGYLDKIPYRAQLKQRLANVWNFEKVTAPFKEGDFTYYYKNNGLQDQYVLYKKGHHGNDEVFIDPNKFSADGTTSLAGVSFSKSGNFVAYSISEGGSDWRKIIVLNTLTKQVVGDSIIDVKFSGISWFKDEGFYYSSYDKPEGSKMSAKTDKHKLYYHMLGQPQSNDELIFGGRADQTHRYVGAYVSEDNAYLTISASVSTSGNRLYIKDLKQINAKIVTILDSFDSDTYLLENDQSTLYFVTNRDAPNRKIVTVDASDPRPSNWVDFISEQKNVLIPTCGGGYFFAKYMIDAVSQLKQYDYDGNLIRLVELPGIGNVIGMRGKKDDPKLYYSFANYKTPGSIYVYDPKSGISTSYWKPNIDFEGEDYVSNQIFYTSKDGTKIPMIITHKNDILMDGNNPTILYGYGGFNISLTPSFSTPISVWLEQGGIYAVPNIRGGGEYGKDWHNAGIKMLKQNVFDDFIAAGEYLIDQNYTSSDRLAVRGGSNGGLLVGAAVTQRPDLMKVALPAVGVLDMLRYHTFTSGAGWAYDYGTVEDNKEMFKYLMGYSPLQNVKKGVDYPATLVTTGDHDDRVVPAHSFKFAAELQDKQSGISPVLIRIETDAGHGAGTPISKTMAQYADMFAFTLFNMGFEELPVKIGKD